MKKDKNETDYLFKGTLETHNEPVSADVWANIKIHLEKRPLKEKKSFATDIDTKHTTDAIKAEIYQNNNRLKKIIPKRSNSVWKILGSFISPANIGTKTSSSNRETADLDETDKLIKDAAAHYPLNVCSSDWEKLTDKIRGRQDSNLIENMLKDFFSSKAAAENKESKKRDMSSFEIKLMPSTFKNKNYWKRYPLLTSPETIERCVSFEIFYSEGKPFELLRFYKSPCADNVLISPGVGEHAFVFAELGFLIHREGYNVFILPKHEAVPFLKLVRKHEDAALHIKTKYACDLHLYGKGLGGFSVLHLALAETINLKTIICENAPVFLSGNAFAKTMNSHRAAGNRNYRLLPFFKSLVKLIPGLTVPVNPYVGWGRLTDFNHEDNGKIEKQLMKAYNEDPDFDRNFSLKTIMSAVSFPLPKAISFLNVPVMFILAKTGVDPEYFEGLYKEILLESKRLEKLEGGFFWMVSNPEEAAQLITNWITHQKNKIKNEQPMN